MLIVEKSFVLPDFIERTVIISGYILFSIISFDKIKRIFTMHLIGNKYKYERSFKMAEKLNLSKSEKLYEEALTLIPGAVLGIRRPYNFVVGEYPIFFDSAKGGRVIDVDGNEFLDYLCAYGPIILGHREEEVDNAVIEQIQNKGFCFSLTQPVQNILSKKLQELIPSCEMSVFVKTGSDATTTAVRISRGFTGRKDRKSTRLNSSHNLGILSSRMPSSA